MIGPVPFPPMPTPSAARDADPARSAAPPVAGGVGFAALLAPVPVPVVVPPLPSPTDGPAAIEGRAVPPCPVTLTPVAVPPTQAFVPDAVDSQAVPLRPATLPPVSVLPTRMLVPDAVDGQAVPPRPATLPPVSALPTWMLVPDAEADRSVPQQAAVFNRDGFFAPAIPLPKPVVVPLAAQPVVPGHPVMADAPLPPAAMVGTMPVPDAWLADGPMAAPPAPPMAIPSRPALTPATPAAPATPVLSARPPRSTETSVSSAPVARPAPPRRALAAAATPVAVAIHAVGQGLEVVARLDRLDPADRDRITDEIAALLARHGHAPRRIAVLARPSYPETR